MTCPPPIGLPAPAPLLAALPAVSDAAAGGGSVTLLIVYLCVAIGFSFLCSIAEAVLLSISPSFVAQKKAEGNAAGDRLEMLKKDVDRPLAAILSLNTIAHTVGAAGVGAESAAVFGSEWIGLTSAVLTLLILVFSEIIPKTLGATYWRSLSGFVAAVLPWLITVMMPLVWLSDGLTWMIARGQKGGTVSRAEIAALAALGEEEGHLDASEGRILTNLLKFRQLKVADIMTPRTVVVAFRQSLTVGDLLAKHPELPVSRLPVFREKLDELTGFVHKNDLLLAHARGENDRPLEEYRRPLTTVRDTASLSELFDLLLDRRAHLAAVVDRFGGFDGWSRWRT